jgi:hypothetical protein
MIHDTLYGMEKVYEYRVGCMSIEEREAESGMLDVGCWPAQQQ